MTKYFLFDCETGGKPETGTSLLTLYGMLLDYDLAVIDTIDLKIKPDSGVYMVEAKAMEVNKIDLYEHSKTAIAAAAAKTEFVDFICKHNLGRDKLIATGHNVAFDVAFGKKLIGAVEWKHQFSKKLLDTGSIAEFLCLTQLLPPSNKMDCSLVGLAKRFDFPFEGAHDAEFDCKLTLKVLKRLLALVKEGTKN